MLLILLTCCDPGRVFEKYEEIPDGIWNVRDTVIFEAEISDTLMPHRLYVHIRQTSAYPFSNLCLLVHTVFPDGHTTTDSVECILADDHGHWLGSGMGDLWDNQILFKRNVVFPVKGRYIFAFEQAQRYGNESFIENLPFIIDLGLRIEKQK